MQKFDMARAWDGAVSLIRGNKDVVLIVAGVFFFLPNLALALFLPEVMGVDGTSAPADQTPEQAIEVMVETMSGYLPLFIVMGLLQAVGVLGLLSLLTDEARPTVGQALQTGAKSLVPYIVAQILQALAWIMIIAIPIALAGITGTPGVGALVALPALAAVIYIAIKFSLVSPVIVIDRVTSPINAMRRSWALTKGNSFRLALFYFRWWRRAKECACAARPKGLRKSCKLACKPGHLLQQAGHLREAAIIGALALAQHICQLLRRLTGASMCHPQQ